MFEELSICSFSDKGVFYISRSLVGKGFVIRKSQEVNNSIPYFFYEYYSNFFDAEPSIVSMEFPSFPLCEKDLKILSKKMYEGLK